MSIFCPSKSSRILLDGFSTIWEYSFFSTLWSTLNRRKEMHHMFTAFFLFSNIPLTLPGQVIPLSNLGTCIMSSFFKQQPKMYFWAESRRYIQHTNQRSTCVEHSFNFFLLHVVPFGVLQNTRLPRNGHIITTISVSDTDVSLDNRRTEEWLFFKFPLGFVVCRIHIAFN